MRGRGLPLRRPLALLFVGLLGSVLALFLLSPSARVLIRTPLVARPQRGPLVAVAFDGQENRREATVHSLALSAVDPRTLAAHDELWLFLSPSGAESRLLRAELRVRGTSCVFEAADGGKLVENEPLALRRSPVCSSLAVPAGVALDLTVEVEGGGELGVWAYQPRAGSAEPGPIQVSRPGPGGAGPPLPLRGFLVDYPPRAPRIELLNDMWQISSSPRWLWLFLAGGVGLALAGCLVFPTRQVASDASRPSLGFAVASGAGAALLAGSLALLYAVLAPPLSGPDEPYHLLGLADLVGDTSLPEKTVAWMGQTHLLRIRFRPGERFRTVDRGNPFMGEDPELRPTEVEMRSAVLAALWRIVGPSLRGQPAPRTLLAIRLLNTLLFASAVGVATALAAACAAAAYPQLLCFPFLFVPALPFFAMHVSETAPLCSAYVLLAIGLVVMFLDGPRAHWAGLPLGLGSGLMLAAGRSPWPLAAIVAAALIARVVLGPNQPGSERRAALVFWSGFAVGGSVFYLLLSDAYRQMVLIYAQFVPAVLRPAARWLLGYPAAAACLVAAAAVLEVSLRSLRGALAARLARPAATLVRWGALTLALLVVLCLVGSLFLPYPQLELEPRHPLTATERLFRILTTMATFFRLRDPNFLLSSSFWVGFGWLDTVPGPAFLSFLALLTAVALVGLLLRLARPPQVRRFLWLLALGLGATLALILYALSTQPLPMALHGRYLIGWYLAVLAVIGSGVALGDSPSAGAPRGPRAGVAPVPRAAVLLVLSGAIHVYCLCFVLWRYF